MSTEINKRKSVFKILFTRVLLLVLLFNIILAAVVIYDTILVEKENIEQRKKAITDEIITTYDFLTSSMETIEELLFYTQENALRKLKDVHDTEDLSTIDLYKKLENFGLDSVYHDLYVIEDGIVINTTFLKDLGLNFYSFGEEHKQLLHDISENGDFRQENFALETATKRLKSYSYQATEDRKYIMEIGSYSEKADEMQLMFKSRIDSIISSEKDILSVNFWFYHENPLSVFIEPYIEIIQDSLISYSMLNDTNLQSSISLNDRNIVTEYLYAETKKGKGAVISIITDITDKNDVVYGIIKKQLLYTVIFLLVLLTVIFLATRSLKKVLKNLLSAMTDIAHGAFNERVKVEGNDEFTTLAENFNQMVEKVETSYNDLNQKNDEILAQRDEIESQRDTVMEQKEKIEEIHYYLSDSINYANRIQKSILSESQIISKYISDHFVFYKPKDIVSGDFYWWTHIEGQTVITAADCTGHGVPGAFMSMLGISFLREIVTKEYITHPGVILRRLRKEIIHTLKQTGAAMEQKDGMDMALVSYNHETKVIQFAGANNPLYLVRNGELIEIKGDKMPIAIYEKMAKFETHEIQLEKNDTIYLFSDGFPDQFGGPKGKKFKYKPFKELLLNNQDKTMVEQKEILDKTFENWKGIYEQIDDVVVLGIRI